LQKARRAMAPQPCEPDTIQCGISSQTTSLNSPICLNSEYKNERISGELSGMIEHPFEIAAAAFRSGGNWCDIMLLHLNVKYCRASENGADQILTVFLGRKYHQPLESAYCGEYGYRVLEDGPDYFKVALTSDSGPLQTRKLPHSAGSRAGGP
jgi:hypothetical protein